MEEVERGELRLPAAWARVLRSAIARIGAFLFTFAPEISIETYEPLIYKEKSYIYI